MNINDANLATLPTNMELDLSDLWSRFVTFVDSLDNAESIQFGLMLVGFSVVLQFLVFYFITYDSWDMPANTAVFKPRDQQDNDGAQVMMLCLFLILSICLSVCLSVCLSICLSVYVSVFYFITYDSWNMSANTAVFKTMTGHR